MSATALGPLPAHASPKPGRWRCCCEVKPEPKPEPEPEPEPEIAGRSLSLVIEAGDLGRAQIEAQFDGIATVEQLIVALKQRLGINPEVQICVLYEDKDFQDFVQALVLEDMPDACNIRVIPDPKEEQAAAQAAQVAAAQAAAAAEAAAAAQAVAAAEAARLAKLVEEEAAAAEAAAAAQAVAAAEAARLAKLVEERQAAAWCTIGTVVKLRQAPPLQVAAPAGLIGVIISAPDDAAMIELQFVDGKKTGRIKASGAAPATLAEAADFNCQTLLGDFDTQLLLDLPPLPQSTMAGRTLAASRFKTAYDDAQLPEVLEMGDCLGRLLRAYCQKEGLDWKQGGGFSFFRDLQKEALQNSQDLQNVPVAAQRMWTSALRLHGREFCFILSEATRDDSAQLIEPAAELARAINQLCVTINRPGMPAAVHPPNNICFRGGGFDDQFRTFFAPGRRFRQPVYLATSFSVEVARRFLARAGSPTKIMWRVHIDPVHKCRHVNLVRRSNVPGEEEYLFAPYSAFKVVKATWAAGTVQQPHVVELLAAVDNQGPSEELPLAPWS
jgi:hypothetical protein